jgi:hypothetical protein
MNIDIMPQGSAVKAVKPCNTQSFSQTMLRYWSDEVLEFSSLASGDSEYRTTCTIARGNNGFATERSTASRPDQAIQICRKGPNMIVIAFQPIV